MICEALARLEFLKPLSEFRYTGFGSVYFGDFALFHRRLGIDKMTTIEGDLWQKHASNLTNLSTV